MGGVQLVRAVGRCPTVKMIARVGDGLDGHFGAIIYNVFIGVVAFHHAVGKIRGGGSHDGGNTVRQVFIKGDGQVNGVCIIIPSQK